MVSDLSSIRAFSLSFPHLPMNHQAAHNQPTNTTALRRGVQRYGFNGQERQKEVASSGQNYSAEFWMYSSALAFRWEIDPKGDPSYSPYNCFKSNPILYADPFGDTVKYGGLGDRINTLLARTFNKGFRSDFKKWKKDEAVFTIDKSSEFGERGLVDAVPCHINCLNEGSSSEHDQFAVYYNKGFRVGDISNKGVKVAVGFMRMPFELGWKIGIKLPVSLTLGPLVVGIRKLFNPNLDVGWGAADRLQLPWDPGNNARGWLSWGFGDYNDFNSIGQRQRNVRIGPSDALTGIRVGGGKKMPIQFIEFGQSMRFEAGGWGYHFRINIWRDGMKGPGSGNAKNDDNIDFRSR